MKNLLIALMLLFIFPIASFAEVDCRDVKSKNQDECVRAKHKNGDRENKDRDSIERDGDDRKGSKNREDIDKDDVKCRNANSPEVRRECLKRK